MKANIVMLTKNRIKLLYQTLRTLYQNTPESLFTLTLVDDASTVPVMHTMNESGRLLREHSNAAVLRIENSKGITGQNRNLGVYWSEKYFGRGDYLYLSDNDLYFTPGWLKDIEVAFVGSDPYQLVGGWNHPYMQPKPSAFSFNGDFKFAFRLHDAVTGSSSLMRWETWDKYGPHDAHAPGVCQSEDYAFCQKIIKDGGMVGSIYPRVLFNCGVTNSMGQPAPGADVMTAELVEAKKRYPDLYYE